MLQRMQLYCIFCGMLVVLALAAQFHFAFCL
jgi:hypothetical protein